MEEVENQHNSHEDVSFLQRFRWQSHLASALQHMIQKVCLSLSLMRKCLVQVENLDYVVVSWKEKCTWACISDVLLAQDCEEGQTQEGVSVQRRPLLNQIAKCGIKNTCLSWVEMKGVRKVKTGYNLRQLKGEENNTDKYNENQRKMYKLCQNILVQYTIFGFRA